MNKMNKYTRGSRWHSRGQRFDPAYLHQNTEADASVFFFFSWRKSLKMSGLLKYKQKWAASGVRTGKNREKTEDLAKKGRQTP